MAVKKKTEKQTGSWVGEVEKYSRQIWLAGLGAYSKVSKDGTKLFDTLVKDGEKAEKAAKSAASSQADEAASSAKPGGTRSRVDEVKEKAIGKWGVIEEAFDKRLNSAISRLGVPSRGEVKALNDKVDVLTTQLEALLGSSAKAPQATKAAVRKPASKPAAAKAVAKPAVGNSAAKEKASKSPAKTAVNNVAAKPAAAKRAPLSKAATTVKSTAKAAADATPQSGTKPVRKPAAKKPSATKVAPKSTTAASPASSVPPAADNQP